MAKESVMNIIPNENEFDTIAAGVYGPGLEIQDESPEILSINAVSIGWQAETCFPELKANTASLRTTGSGASTITFNPRAKYPVVIAGYYLEFAADKDEPQGDLTVEITETFADGRGSKVDYFTGQFNGSVILNNETRMFVVRLCNDVQRNALLGAAVPAAPRLMQPYIWKPKVLFDETTDPQYISDRNLSSVSIEVKTAVTTLTYTVGLITPGSRDWNTFVSAMFEDNVASVSTKLSTDKRTAK